MAGLGGGNFSLCVLVLAFPPVIFSGLATTILHRPSLGEVQPLSDPYDDPLPPGAVHRLGTVRFRHGAAIFHLAFSPDGRILAASDWYTRVVLWDMVTGRKLKEFFGTAIAFSPDGKVLAIGDRVNGFCLREISSGKTLRVCAGHKEYLRCLAFSPNGSTLASGGADGIVRIWETASGKELCQLKGHGGWVNSVSFSPNGKTLGSASNDHTIRLWDVTSGKELSQYGNRDDLHGGTLVFSPDGKTIAAGGDGVVCIWNIASGRGILRINAHKGHVACLAFTPNGSDIFSVSFRTIYLWNAATGKLLQSFVRAGDGIESIALSPDGKTLAVGGHNNAIDFWDLASRKERSNLGGHLGQVVAVRFSYDSSTIFTGGRDARIRTWDSSSGKERHTFRVPEAEAFHVAFSPDGDMVATSGAYYDHAVRILGVPTGKELGRLEHCGTIYSLAFSPDGTVLATGCDDNCVYLWEVATGRRLRQLHGHENHARRRQAPGVFHLAFSPDGKLLASAGADDTIRLWNVAMGREQLRLTDHDYSITALAFSADGQTLASGNDDRRIRLWEVATGKVRCRIAQTRGVNALAFSRDGKILVAGGLDTAIHVWDVGTCKELRQVAGHLGPVCSLAFSPDGKTLASGSEDTTVLLWDVSHLNPRTPPRAIATRPSDLEIWWTDLASGDASKAYRAQWAFVHAGDSAVPSLKKKLQPAPAIDPRKITRFIADLDSDRFEVREKASAELTKLGDLAENELRKALAGMASVELRQRAGLLLEDLERPITLPDQLRTVRAVELLEKIGTPEARKVLNALAQGAPQARLTREAKLALCRLDRLPTR